VSTTAKTVGVAPREIPASAVPPISPEQAAAVRSLVAEGRPSLRTPRQLARFLCGLTSPATTRERLGRHAAFGVLARVPFADVLAEAETLLQTAR
jgi:ATP-dependent DNA helicase RecQ